MHKLIIGAALAAASAVALAQPKYPQRTVEVVVPYAPGGGTDNLMRMITGIIDENKWSPVPLNVVCFRYAPAGTSEADRNAWNREILMRLQERGIAAPSSTVLGGRFAIRAAIVNHRSRRGDFEALVEAVRRIAKELRNG